MLLDKLRKLIAKLFLKFKINKGVFYINGPDLLPPPLSQEEESECIEKLGFDEEAKSRLIEHNLRLVVYIAKKFENTGVGIEDLISIGCIGLIKAIGTYKPGRGTALATYTARCIENEILMLIRANKKHKNTMSLTDPVGVDKDGNELTLLDLLFEKEDCVFEQVERSVQRERLLYQIKELLSDREYTIICLRKNRLTAFIFFTSRDIWRPIAATRTILIRPIPRDISE